MKIIKLFNVNSGKDGTPSSLTAHVAASGVKTLMFLKV